MRHNATVTQRRGTSFRSRDVQVRVLSVALFSCAPPPDDYRRGVSETKTRAQAFERVALAQVGCLAGKPTEEYLLGLREYLYRWIGEVDAAIATVADPCPFKHCGESDCGCVEQGQSPYRTDDYYH